MTLPFIPVPETARTLPSHVSQFEVNVTSTYDQNKKARVFRVKTFLFEMLYGPAVAHTLVLCTHLWQNFQKEIPQLV